MLLKEITDYLEDVAPLDYQESYDNSGLIYGRNYWEIRGVLLSLDCTEEVVKEAIEKNVNLIISHHPILFSGIKKIRGNTYIERVLELAIKNEIAIYAIHTNLDNVLKNGVNEKIAKKLGLINTQVLEPKKGNFNKLITFVPKEFAESLRKYLGDAGAGMIGDYDNCAFQSEGYGFFRPLEEANPFVGEKNQIHTEPEVKLEFIYHKYKENKVLKALIENHPYEEPAYDIISLENKDKYNGSGLIGELVTELDVNQFLELVKQSFYTSCIKYTPVDKKIRKVALCGGSGSFLLFKAIQMGADAFLSSDFKYHQFFDAEGKILISDIGHFESEQFTPELLGEVLLKKFPNFAILFSQINTNPIKYYS